MPPLSHTSGHIPHHQTISPLPLTTTLCRQLRLQVLVNGISNRLARRDAHDARRDTPIQSPETFLFEERASDCGCVGKARVARWGGIALN